MYAGLMSMEVGRGVLNMELYILSKQDLSILSTCKVSDYQINLDEETNAKSTFTLMKTNGLKKENYMVLNGLYRQFIFVIDDVQTEKGSDVVTVTVLDISNIFDRKVIEKNIDIMKSKSIEEFLANTISEDFVNSDDTALNVSYIEIYWHTNTQGNVATNAENGLYNFHTFLTNCRQYKNIYTDFKLENLGNPQTVEGKRINVEAKNRKIVDISLHGESTQNGTPTPDSPIEIENIEGNIEFKVEGKNLFDKTKFKAINRATYTYSNGIYAITPLGTGNVSLDIYINLPAGIYTYSGNGSNATQVKNSSGTTIANNVSSSNTTFTITEEGTYIRFNWGTGTSTDAFTLDTNNIQIESGSTATDYEPYKSQVATFPLGEEKLMEGSYLADDGIHHKRKQIVLNGTEGIINVYVNTSTTRFGFSSSLTPDKKIGLDNVLSTHFKCDTTVYYDSQTQVGICGNARNVNIYIRVNGNITTDEFKTWLATQYANGTPVIVEYELSEEEIVPYTTEQQEAWNNIKNLTLFEGVNHISSDANMVLKYYPLEPVGLKFVLRIDIENKQETTELIDTTLPEVTDYNKIYEADVTAKVQVYIREDGSEYNLYLKTDRTTTTNKNDPDRASGKIEVISVDTVENAPEEALNVMKGNNYKHLVEFKIAKTSKLMDITKLHIRKTYKNQNRRRYI